VCANSDYKATSVAITIASLLELGKTEIKCPVLLLDETSMLNHIFFAIIIVYTNLYSEAGQEITLSIVLKHIAFKQSYHVTVIQLSGNWQNFINPSKGI
jgi:hypothetical protein